MSEREKELRQIVIDAYHKWYSADPSFRMHYAITVAQNIISNTETDLIELAIVLDEIRVQANSSCERTSMETLKDWADKQ